MGGVGGGLSGKPDKSSLWMDLFSLDSVILIVVTGNNCFPFSFSRSIFWRHIS